MEIEKKGVTASLSNFGFYCKKRGVKDIKVNVQIEVSSYFKDKLDNTKELEINIERGTTVKDLLFELGKKHEYLMTFAEKGSDEELRRHMIVTHKGKILRLNDKIEDNCNLRFIPPLSGG